MLKVLTKQFQFWLMFLPLAIFGVLSCNSDHSEFKTDPPVPEAASVSVDSSQSDKVETQTSEFKEFDGIRFKVPAG